MTVMAILAMVVAVTLTQSLASSRTSRQRVVAANIIAQQMDSIRNAGAATVNPGDPNPTPVTIDGTTYTMAQTVRWVTGPDASVDTCAGTGSTLYKSVSITATWPSMGDVKPVRSDTVLTPALNDVNPNYITIPIKVRDATNTGKSGVAVTLSGTGVSTTSQLTDNNGCVLFANVPPGNYSATVTSASTPATVNWQGVSNYSFPVGTTIAGTWLSTYDFQWDTSAQLTLTPTGASGYQVPAGVGATALQREPHYGQRHPDLPDHGHVRRRERPVPVQLDLLRLGELGRGLQRCGPDSTEFESRPRNGGDSRRQRQRLAGDEGGERHAQHERGTGEERTDRRRGAPGNHRLWSGDL